MILEEVNMQNIDDYCKRLYQLVKSDFDYDLVIFVAKGGYLLGKKMADYNHCEFLSIFATRKGNRFKKALRFILKLLPKGLIQKLREREVQAGIHRKHSERCVSFDAKEYQFFKPTVKKILIVDDSVDTGSTVSLTVNAIQNFFEGAEVRFASLNVMKNSSVYPNYYLFENVLVRGPWSSDSKENKRYLKEYFDWCNQKEKRS